MSRAERGRVEIYLVMLLATVAVTIGVALTLFGKAERSRSWVLSLTMLCVAEALLFAFPVYHSRAAADRGAPAFAFGFGFQVALVVYLLGVVGLCWVSDFRDLAIAHSVWFLALLLTAGFWRIGSGHATATAATATARRLDFMQIRLRVGSFAANVALGRAPAMRPFVAAVAALKDDVTHATPETLPGTESFNHSLLAALERAGAEYARVRAALAASTLSDADVPGLVDRIRAMVALVRERDAAIRAAR